MANSDEKQEEAAQKLEKLKAELPELIDIIGTRDKNEVLLKQQDLLEYVNFVEEAMVREFPFAVPPEYKTLPQLKALTHPPTLVQLSHIPGESNGRDESELQGEVQRRQRHTEDSGRRLQCTCDCWRFYRSRPEEIL